MSYVKSQGFIYPLQLLSDANFFSNGILFTSLSKLLHEGSVTRTDNSGTALDQAGIRQSEDPFPQSSAFSFASSLSIGSVQHLCKTSVI